MLNSLLAFALFLTVFGGGFALAVIGFIREMRKVDTDELSRQFPFRAENRLIVMPRKGTYVAGGLLGFAAAVCMVGIAIHAEALEAAMIALVLLAAIYFVVHNVKMLLWSGPILIADQNGIQYRRWSNVPIPWDAMIALKRIEYKERERIMIIIDPAYRLSGKVGRLIRTSEGKAVYVNLADTDHRLGHLLAVFRANRPHLYRQVVNESANR